MALERDDVVVAAVRILDDFGLADLSMRRVADVLGVKAGALYWHVANKQTLLAAVADRVLGELDQLDPPRAPAGDARPGARLADWAAQLRRVLLGHRDSAELVATALASRLCETDPLARPAELLRAAGVSPHEAAWGAAAVLHLVLGHVVEEQNAQLMGELGVAAPVTPDHAGFEYGVAALVHGLVASRNPSE